MVLVDSCLWIEFFGGNGISGVGRRIKKGVSSTEGREVIWIIYLRKGKCVYCL